MADVPPGPVVECPLASPSRSPADCAPAERRVLRVVTINDSRSPWMIDRPGGGVHLRPSRSAPLKTDTAFVGLVVAPPDGWRFSRKAEGEHADQTVLDFDLSVVLSARPGRAVSNRCRSWLRPALISRAKTGSPVTDRCEVPGC